MDALLELAVSAFGGWLVGILTFMVVWAVIVEMFVKDERDKFIPSWPVLWAASAGFAVAGIVTTL